MAEFNDVITSHKDPLHNFIAQLILTPETVSKGSEISYFFSIQSTRDLFSSLFCSFFLLQFGSFFLCVGVTNFSLFFVI